MTRGRKPKPIELKRLMGNPGKRSLSGGITGVPSKGRVPSSLKGDTEAVAAWKRFAKLLVAQGVLTTSDEDALAAMCMAWSDFRRACVEIEKARPLGGEVLPVFKESLNPETGEMESAPVPGSWQINKWVRQRDHAWARYVKLLPEFGLTPSSRARVPKNAPADATDPFESLRLATGTED